AQYRPRRPSGQRADGCAALIGHAVRPGGIYPVVLYAGSGPSALRAAVIGRRVLHDRLVYSLQHVRASDVYLASAALPRRQSPVAPLVLRGPAPGRLRLAPARRPQGPLVTAGRLPGR